MGTNHEKIKRALIQHMIGEGYGSCYAYLKTLGAQIRATEFFAFL